jgi:hypothetical protein
MDMPVQASPRRACSFGKRGRRSSKPKSSRLQTSIRAELIGSDSCTALGITVEASAPVLAMCRALLAAGHDPATRLDVYRGDVLCLRVRSIGEGAALEINTKGTGFAARHAVSTAPLVRQIDGGGL